ncbi:MAG: ATP-binding protein [Methanobacterium sp.]|nr:ATP-binding protein [Methanobacterium sp.]
MLIIGLSLVFLNNHESKTILGNTITFTINIFAVIALFFAASYCKRSNKDSYLAWLLIAFAQLSYLMGDLAWGILEIGLNQDPTLSVANLFYFLYYPLFVIGILILPKYSDNHYKKVDKLIEIGIIMISVILIFFILLINPIIQLNAPNSFLSLVPLLYVFLDLFLFFSLVVLIFNWLDQINQLPFLILGIGVLVKIITDCIFLYMFSYGTYFSGSLVDLGWIYSYILFILAAISQINGTKISFEYFSNKHLLYFRKIHWNIYLPLLLLSLAYVFLLWGNHNLNKIDVAFLEIFFGLILILVILRQIISFKENRRLYMAAKNELKKREITEMALNKVLINLDEEIDARTLELEKLIKELKRSNKELEVFAYVASHDLQEPLRTITSFTQLLERRYKGKLDDDADEFIEFIVDGANRMKQMILDLLEYSRITTKGQEFKPVNIENIINYALDSLIVLIKENDAVIKFDNLPIVNGDESQLVRVFQNLISNAIKFKKDDKPPEICISAKKEGNEYIFKVADNGIGIEEQYFDVIFTIFKRLHTREEYEGTGIGLSITKRVIERHGGKIWVESQLNKGTTFYFTIPK